MVLSCLFLVVRSQLSMIREGGSPPQSDDVGTRTQPVFDCEISEQRSQQMLVWNVCHVGLVFHFMLV